MDRVIASADLHPLGALLGGSLLPGDCPPEEWPAIRAAALEQRLAPMLLWTVQQATPALAAAPDWEPIRQAAREAVVHHLLLEQAQAELAAAWQAAEIPCLWLKGIALAATVYPRPDLRPMSDLDVLVPFAAREGALALARDLGYAFTDHDHGLIFATGDPIMLDMSHHYHLVHAGAGGIVLELHYRLDAAILPQAEQAWFRVATRTVNGVTMLTPEATLLYLCAHAILQHGEWQLDLLWVHDIHRLLLTDRLDWEQVIAQAVRFRWTFAVERMLALAAEYFGTPLPEGVLPRLRAGRPAEERLFKAASRRGAGARWAIMGEKMLALPWHDRARFVREMAFPPPVFMRRRYAIPPGAPVWPYYPYRWLDHAREVAAWAWQRLRHTK